MLEQRLSGATALFEPRWHARCELHDVDVQQRHAYLHSNGHPGTVGVVEVVVGQKMPRFEKQHALQWIQFAWNELQALEQGGCGIQAVDLPGEVGSIKGAPHLLRAPPEIRD